MKIGFLFPGQGSQSIGMGKDLYEKYEEVRNIYNKAKEIYITQTKQYVVSLSGQLDSLATTTSNLLGQSEIEIERLANSSIICATIVILVVFISVLILFRYNIKSIVNPILTITEASKNLSEGRLDFEIPLIMK